MLATPASETHARSEKAGGGAAKLRCESPGRKWLRPSRPTRPTWPARAAEARNLRDRAGASSSSGPCDGARREEVEGRSIPLSCAAATTRSTGPRLRRGRRACCWPRSRPVRSPRRPGLPRRQDRPAGRRWRRWLAGADNPLTARVIVNRLWQHHFGRGIVATPSDFGVRGEPPSHPELLDWLASELVAQGWRFKPLHRLIVTSATYRQSSKPARSSPPTIPRTRSSAG